MKSFVLGIKVPIKGSGCGSLVEQLLPISEVRGSNPVIGKIYIEHCLRSTVLKRQKLRKKEAGNGPFLVIREYFLIYSYSFIEGAPQLSLTKYSRDQFPRVSLTNF